MYTCSHSLCMLQPSMDSPSQASFLSITNNFPSVTVLETHPHPQEHLLNSKPFPNPRPEIKREASSFIFCWFSKTVVISKAQKDKG